MLEKTEGSLNKAIEMLSNFNTLPLNNYYLYGKDIPQKKFNNAINSFLFAPQNETILIFHDSTVFGSAKEGFCLTDKALYSKSMFEKAEKIDISDISSFYLIQRL